MHEDFLTGDQKLKGACLDLGSAYKQCPVHPADHHCAIFAPHNPDSEETGHFRMNSLPSGATAAVHGFNRAAEAINTLIRSYVQVPCTNCFDDFTIIGPEGVIGKMVKFTKKFEVYQQDNKKKFHSFDEEVIRMKEKIEKIY